MYSLIDVEYIIIILALILLSVDGLPLNRYKRHAWAYSSNVNVRCFSSDSLVKLSNGQDKQIDLLEIGDEILTIDQSKLVSTEFVIMLDKHKSKEALFYKLKTSCGNEISLTEYHLIPILSSSGNQIYKFAKQIQIKDNLYILLNNQINFCPVVNITSEIKKGYYAPLTMKGTLLVNQILVSSFAHINNHHHAQLFMFPFRFYYKLIRFFSLNDSFYISKSEGLHWFIKIIFYFALYFKEDILFLS